MACCRSTSSGYIRGADGHRAEIGRAGEAAQARHAAAECGGVAGGSGSTGRSIAAVGVAVDKAARARWHGCPEAPTALWSSAQAQRYTTRRAHRGAQARSAGSWLHQRAVDAAPHRHADQRTLWGAVLAILRLETAATVGVECAASHRPCSPTRRSGHPHLEGQEVAGDKKIAARQGRIIVFIDESGLSERPCRARTWSPKGQTPVLQYSFSWKQLSVIAGVSFWRFYFRFFPGSIKSPQVVEFLKALHKTIGGRLLIVWDRLQAHRSRLVKEYLESLGAQIALEYLPAYAPELNPVEYIWGYLKHHAMPNFCARDLGDLKRRASHSLRSMQRRTTLVTAFWQQAELF